MILDQRNLLGFTKFVQIMAEILQCAPALKCAKIKLNVKLILRIVRIMISFTQSQSLDNKISKMIFHEETKVG